MPNKLAYRRATLDELGGGGVYTTTADAASTTRLTCATAFKSSDLPSNALAGGWVYVPSVTAPKQSMVTRDALTASTGTFTLSSALGTSAASGVAFELSMHMPLIDGGAKLPGLSIDQSVILGLRHLKVRLEASLPITTSDEYDISTVVRGVDRPDRLISILEPNPIVGRRAVPSKRGWEFISDSDVYKLRCDLPFRRAVGDLTLIAERPAENWIFASGGSDWGYDAGGLVADADQAWPDLDHGVTAALVFCYASCADRYRGARGDEYRSMYAAQLEKARNLRFWDHSRDRLGPDPATAQAAATQQAVAA